MRVMCALLLNDVCLQVYQNICSPLEMAGKPSRAFPGLNKLLKGHRKVLAIKKDHHSNSVSVPRSHGYK